MTDPTALRPDLLPVAVVEEIDSLFTTAVAEHRTAGVTWGVVGGHDHGDVLLAHGAAGHRELRNGEPTAASTPMDRGTISRICSMTKSFTAATILALRDEGRLRLDDPITEHVPEAAGIRLPSGSPQITLRHLLTMSAGFVTDNPWGDRQQPISREQFADILAGSLGFVHLPGTGFEYSNTGYSLLGRVIDEITGEDFGAHITARILRPLGLTSTGFAREEVDASRTATGHRLADRADATRFEPLPFDAHGVYGAMAGLFSSVDDVAAWTRFLAAADAPDAADHDQSVLSTASRREMQQLHRIQHTPALPSTGGKASAGFDRIRGYGYGLVIEEFPDLGEIVSHSGGFPGYGSFMAWHRDTGLGIVALANSKYAPAVPLSMQALRLLRERCPELLAARVPTLMPRTREAAQAALDWLRHAPALAPGEQPADSDAAQRATAIADAWFAENMDPDVPRDERARRRDQALAAAGVDAAALTTLRLEDAQVLSPAQLQWRVPGTVDGKQLQIMMLMDPRRQCQIQQLDLAAVDA